MSYWSIAALLIAASYLLGRRLSMPWSISPSWLVSATPSTSDYQEPSQDIHEENASSPGPDTSTNDPLESDSTPKANPVEPAKDVPIFSLEQPDDKLKGASPPHEGKPIFPALNSAHRVSSMPPPPKPTVDRMPKPTSNLMPPATRAPIVQRAPPPSAAASLRVPSGGPLPNRGPPGNSQQRASGGLSPNGALSTTNSRGKVLLSPGHSPMDWAALTRSGNLAGVSSFQRVTPSQLRSMTGRKGKPAWSSWQGKVYNITPYLPFHPGGEPELMKAAGRDGTKLFMDNHPWVNWENMLGSCLVGVLVPEDYAQSSLEDMD